MKPAVSHTHGHEHEHEIEPQYGLPEELPPAEKILWQGAPDWKALARHAFHLRTLVVYFGVIIAIRVFVVMTDGLGMQTAMVSALWLALLASAAIGTLALIAYFSAKTSVYTITNRRLIMRVGIVLTVTFNLPFKRIASAGFRQRTRGTGDIPVALMGNDKIAYAHIWPHARPWRFTKPEPMLRCVPNAQAVAAILSNAWSAHLGLAVAPSDQAEVRASRPNSAAGTSPSSPGQMSAA
jgi:hypothetical protein